MLFTFHQALQHYDYFPIFFRVNGIDGVLLEQEICLYLACLLG